MHIPAKKWRFIFSFDTKEVGPIGARSEERDATARWAIQRDTALAREWGKVTRVSLLSVQGRFTPVCSQVTRNSVKTTNAMPYFSFFRAVFMLG